MVASIVVNGKLYVFMDGDHTLADSTLTETYCYRDDEPMACYVVLYEWEVEETHDKFGCVYAEEFVSIKSARDDVSTWDRGVYGDRYKRWALFEKLL